MPCTSNLTIIVIAPALAFLAACSNSKEPKPVPEKYRSYQFLSNSEAKPKSVGVVKVLDYEELERVNLHSAFYDSSSQLFTVLVQFAKDSIAEFSVTRFDKKGQIVEAFTSGEDELVSSMSWQSIHRDWADGIVFYKHHYLDVFGKSTIQFSEYAEEVDMGSLSVEDFASLYAKAELVYYGTVSYDFDRVELAYLFSTYMRVNKKWVKLRSNVLTAGDTREPAKRDEARTFASSLYYATSKNDVDRGLHYVLDVPTRFPEKPRPETIPLETFTSRSSPVLSHKYQAKEHYVSCSLAGAFSPTGGNCKSGWRGADYYNVDIGENKLGFKSYGSIRVLHPKAKDYSVSKDSGPTLIQVNEGFGDYGETTESGLFLITPVTH